MTGRFSKLIISLICLLGLFSASALDIDEKLTFRILQTSDTKKTILVNRGLEDGLVVGDHAKLFITTGVFARGVVIRATPSRSVWSIYRIVKPNEIHVDKVANLKISSPVKLTEDRTKSLQAATSGRQMGEPVDVQRQRNSSRTQVVQDTPRASYDEQSELDAIKTTGFASDQSIERRTPSKILSDKNMAFNISAGLNMLSGTYDNVGDATDAEISAIGLNGEFEYFFAKSDSFLQKFSLKATLGYYSGETGIAGSTATSIDFGGAVDFHFTNPLATNRITPYLEAGFGLSLATLDAIPQSSGSSVTESLSGSGTYMFAGAGAKYTMDSGFGFYAKGDYFSTSSTFSIETGGSTVDNTIDFSGFRAIAGAYLRF
ncbi:hypothetical protein BALOs_1475 [Halobacteriovorax sp. BALOs_7]|uniref:Outer membrane protein beta-barrel domain-containing protein n=1 Tax=Halobacteriovorax vibrionivorans TaxID=2152716 RepID=A0ABY0IC51_9BACT|nr:MULTISPECIES: hypothetical protein [Halobacteriovorax]AYF44476.1 hypothetical protein BALOs_1475 [Halobacteriovorax sp. BALOs_7]RZF20537.1 hypothetical protein DAY19_11155 [Halobacteriovorax vibrionivorans]TGD47450.1 hypothetical protein EP118_07685 [Halobacteriovorax sp. Y22]